MIRWHLQAADEIERLRAKLEEKFWRETLGARGGPLYKMDGEQRLLRDKQELELSEMVSRLALRMFTSALCFQSRKDLRELMCGDAAICGYRRWRWRRSGENGPRRGPSRYVPMIQNSSDR